MSATVRLHPDNLERLSSGVRGRSRRSAPTVGYRLGLEGLSIFYR